MPMLKDVNGTGYKSVISAKSVLPSGAVILSDDLDSRRGGDGAEDGQYLDEYDNLDIQVNSVGYNNVPPQQASQSFVPADYEKRRNGRKALNNNFLSSPSFN